jgi:hypothetical protein
VEGFDQFHCSTRFVWRYQYWKNDCQSLTQNKPNWKPLVVSCDTSNGFFVFLQF